MRKYIILSISKYRLKHTNSTQKKAISYQTHDLKPVKKVCPTFYFAHKINKKGYAQLVCPKVCPTPFLTFKEEILKPLVFPV